MSGSIVTPWIERRFEPGGPLHNFPHATGLSQLILFISFCAPCAAILLHM
jgi:hypothetical protein